MREYQTDEQGWVILRDGTKCQERYACRCQGCQAHPKGPDFADDRYSLGIYAGRYCDVGWRNSGYRDCGAEGYNYLDAGEHYGASDY